MLYQTFLFLGQLWQLFEVSQILEFLQYIPQVVVVHVSFLCPSLALASDLWPFLHLPRKSDEISLMICKIQIVAKCNLY